MKEVDPISGEEVDTPPELFVQCAIQGVRAVADKMSALMSSPPRDAVREAALQFLADEGQRCDRALSEGCDKEDG